MTTPKTLGEFSQNCKEKGFSPRDVPLEVLWSAAYSAGAESAREEMQAETNKRDDLLRDALDILNSVDSSECGCIDRKIWIDCEKLDITVKELTQEKDNKK